MASVKKPRKNIFPWYHSYEAFKQANYASVTEPSTVMCQGAKGAHWMTQRLFILIGIVVR